VKPLDWLLDSLLVIYTTDWILLSKSLFNSVRFGRGWTNDGYGSRLTFLKARQPHDEWSCWCASLSHRHVRGSPIVMNELSISMVLRFLSTVWFWFDDIATDIRLSGSCRWLFAERFGLFLVWFGSVLFLSDLRTVSICI